MIASLTESDLVELGLRTGHAKLVAPHLGGLKPAPAPAEAPANITVTGVMDPAADARSQAASDATVDALMRLSRRDIAVDKLNDGVLQRPTVKHVMQWATAHADRATGSHSDVAVAIEKIKKSCVVNLAGLHDTLEDKEYYKIVRRSLTTKTVRCLWKWPDDFSHAASAGNCYVNGAEAICTASEGCVQADENVSNVVEDSSTCKD